MSNKTIFKIAFVPIWFLFILFALQYIFGLISAPDSFKVVLGVVLLSCIILISLFIFRKIYFTHE